MARIVLADDEVDLVEIFAEILREEGHAVQTATDGVEALRTIRAWRPDVAIVDLDMPGMSGSSIARELSKAEDGLEDLPVILLSGNANVESIAAEVGVHCSVIKPIGIDRLLETVQTALRS